jgi:hypothetical protein
MGWPDGPGAAVRPFFNTDQAMKERKMTQDKTLGKSMAKSAAIGAVIAIPVPFVGPILGAAAGAGYAWYKAKKRGL